MKTSSIFQLTTAINEFFNSQGFTQIYCPPVVENPGMETHIHPMKVLSVNSDKPKGFLHTSPEFYMKKVLASSEFENLFTLSFSHRDEPTSPIHRPQFLMLEWYRKNKTYLDIMEDTKRLIQFCYKAFEKEFKDFQVFTVSELFKRFLDFDILDYLDFTRLEKHIRKNHPDISLSNEMDSWEWDDLFFILFLNKIEPELEKMGNIIIKDYPAPLAALSTLKTEDPRVCERFEVYINGIEIANCFNELTDKDELKERFDAQNDLKNKLYHYRLPEPEEFYKTMINYPASAGIALGVERLFQVITQQNDFLVD